MSNFNGKFWFWLTCSASFTLHSCGAGESDLGEDHSHLSVEEENLIVWDKEHVSYLVAFWDQVPQGAIAESLGSLNARLRDLFTASTLDSVRSINPIAAFTRQELTSTQTPQAPLQDMVGIFRQNRSLGMQNDFVISEVVFPDSDSARLQLRNWKERGLIAYAEPNYASHLKSKEELEALLEPYRGGNGVGNAWWLASMQLLDAYSILSEKAVSDPAWAENLFRNPPVIAVLDSGIDYEHPALIGSLFKPTSANTAGCHNDEFGCNTTVQSKGFLGNGDVYPYGTSGPGQSCFSDGLQNSNLANSLGVCGHGTHVAGLIAGSPQANSQTGGVCPFCKILPVRVVSEALDGKIPDSAILAGLKYISLFKRNDKPLVRVINMSFGKYTRSRSVSLMIRLLRDQGTLMVAAAGNEDSMKRAYPAAYGDAVAVSALDRSSRRAPYSNFGPWVDIAAPGGAAEDVESSFPGGFYLGQNGTSQAAPLVAGVAGLYVAMNPEAGYEEIRDALLSSANGGIYNEDFADGYNRYYLKRVEGESIYRPLLGSGAVDAFAALSQARQGYVAAKNNPRVTYGCGVVGGPNATSPSSLFLLLLPLLFFLRKFFFHKII